MEKEVDIEEVKKVLEDANMYEPNMPRDEMISYYNAINDSKSTANEEDESRRLHESQDELLNLLDENTEDVTSPLKTKEKAFTPKAWSSDKNITVKDNPERNNNQDDKDDELIDEIINDTPKDATKAVFGFNDMARDSECKLTIINHELKFVPIQNSQKFLNAGTSLKIKMLYAYHTKINKMKSQLARMSYYPAPVSKFTSILEKFPNTSDDDYQETYICRSGRQTKRKVYYDGDEDSLDEFVSQKKTKNLDEQEWLSKSTPSKQSIRSNTSKKLLDSNHIAESEKIEAENLDTALEKQKENTKPTPKTETRTPFSKKISNTEIMRRSSLFGDTPKKRSETMFDKLKEEEEKRLKEETAREIFLEKIEEENSQETSQEEIINVDDDEPVKRRVVPRIPARKPIGRKRNKANGTAPLDITVTAPTQKKTLASKQSSSTNSSEEFEETPKTNVRKKLMGRRAVSPIMEPADSPSTSRVTRSAPITSEASGIACPICSKLFPEDKIQAHASSCGDESITTRAGSKVSRISCEICDKVVDFTTDYEAHVKDCLAKKQKNS